MKDKDVKVIGICGAARAGKDTLAGSIARILLDTENEKFQDHVVAVESFASPIKSMIAMLLDFFGYGSIMNSSSLTPYLEGDKKEEVLENIGVSTRVLMQTLGTEWGRALIHDDLWLNSMEERIGHYGEAVKHGHKGAFVLISDVRFDNEAEMIKRNGGTIVKIVSDRDTTEEAEHASEAGVSACMVDAYVTNNDSIDVLNDRALKYLEGLLESKLGEHSADYKDYKIVLPEDDEDETN